MELVRDYVLTACVRGNARKLAQLLASPDERERLQAAESLIAATAPSVAPSSIAPWAHGVEGSYRSRLRVVQWLYSPKRVARMPAMLAHLVYPVLRQALHLRRFHDLIEALFDWPPYWDVVSDELHQRVLDALLRDAMRHRKGDKAALLIAHGAQVNQEGELLALIGASNCFGGHQYLELLVENGVFVVGADVLGRVATREAARKLVEYGANCNTCQGESVLVLAAPRISFGAVLGILDGGCVDLDARDEQGKTALMKAVVAKSTTCSFMGSIMSESCVKALIDSGADVTLRDHHGLAALDHIIGSYRPQHVKWLLVAGADPNIATHCSRWWQQTLENLNERSLVELELLLRYGADPHLADGENESIVTRLSKTEIGRAFMDSHRRYFSTGTPTSA